MSSSIAFIGGGNMAVAIIAGLIRSGRVASTIHVLEPLAQQRDLLTQNWGVTCHDQPGPGLSHVQTVVWAVKPQHYLAAATTCQAHVQQALQLSVMAGIRSGTLVRTLGTQRVARAMPNTPALIGQGIAGLYAHGSVTAHERLHIETLLASTGQTLWFEDESALDAVTALSGSGPAYVLYVIEALVEAAQLMGLTSAQGLTLALETFRGVTALVSHSGESPAQLRKKVTSKGGTTHAAISMLENHDFKDVLIQAVRAAQARAQEMGDEFDAYSPQN